MAIRISRKPPSGSLQVREDFAMVNRPAEGANPLGDMEVPVLSEEIS